MGLNLKHFEDGDIEPNFICSHCHGVFVDPVLCKCSHILCWICFKRRKKRKLNCLACSDELGVSSGALQSEWLKELCAFRVICPKGCKKIFPFEFLTEHFDNECEFALTTCTSSGCTRKVRRTDLPVHLETCDFRIVSCCCGAKTRFMDLRQHQIAQKCVVKQNLQTIVRKRREMEQAIKEHRLNMQRRCFEEECEQRRLIRSKQGSVRLPTAMSVRSEPVLSCAAKNKPITRSKSSQSAPGPLQRTALTCRHCGKLYSKSNNHERACTWHYGVSSL